MRNRTTTSLRASERGAIQIKTALALAVVLIGAFIVIKIAPVYIEQRQITHDVDELARIASVRRMEKDKIGKQIADIQNKYSLKEGTINLVEAQQGRVNIAINYAVPIDFFVTTYNWQYNYTAEGREF